MLSPARPLPVTVLALVLGLGLAACGADDPAPPVTAPASDWASVLAEADGQSVNWYMDGDDDALNTFVADQVAPRLADLGVTLEQVPISTTADAVDQVLGEVQAGRDSGGSVDAIWINGENFATGVQADLWRCDWAQDLPNARYVDLDSPEIRRDFGTPVQGCEAAWQRDASALVYDAAALDADDVASVSSLFAWARAHPGRFTYPAPPDSTGSMAVRTILYDTLGGPGPLVGNFDEASDQYVAATTLLWRRLNQIAPALWRRGATYPKSQADVERLYADGEVSAFFTYRPGAVAHRVREGTYPDTTREAVPSIGNIGNVSFLAVPQNAAHQAGALVLANVLQEPEVQLALYRDVGSYPAIEVGRTDAETQAGFADAPTGTSQLTLAQLNARAQPELPSDYISAIQDEWRTQVLRR